MPPGVLWVSSRIHLPSTITPSVPQLTPSSFCSWYENQHIGEVTALSGVPRAARYEALAEQPDGDGWSAEAPWLTVYEMPEIAFRESQEFKSLDGQSMPKDDLLDRVFRQARFDTRFYEEVGRVEENNGADADPAKFLISYASSSRLSEAEVKALQSVPGFQRARMYRVVNATTLDRFERLEADVKGFVALVELGGEEVDVEKVRGVLGDGGAEVGWYQLKRTYS